MKLKSFIASADKRTIKRIFFGGAVVCWCITIFLLSAQNADESSMTSGGFIRRMLELFVPDFLTGTAAERAAMINRLQFAVRKTAHFTAYFVLGFLAAQVFLAFPKLKTSPRMCLGAWLFSVLYAVSDEVHQSFVPGRAMQLRDVIIDSTGALLGVTISYGLSCAVYRHYERKKQRTAAAQKNQQTQNKK